MQRAALGREVTVAGRRLALGEPVRQVFEPIDQADTQCDAAGWRLLSISLPLWGRAGWGLARPEELGNLTGPVIADQQATVGSFGDGQRMREPHREIGHLPALACAGPGKHHP